MRHHDFVGFRFLALIMILAAVLAGTTWAMERKTVKPELKSVTYAEAEDIAKDSILAYFERQSIQFDSLLLKSGDVVHKLDSSFGVVSHIWGKFRFSLSGRFCYRIAPLMRRCQAV